MEGTDPANRVNSSHLQQQTGVSLHFGGKMMVLVHGRASRHLEDLAGVLGAQVMRQHVGEAGAKPKIALEEELEI
jgi:hypothetical protein